MTCTKSCSNKSFRSIAVIPGEPRVSRAAREGDPGGWSGAGLSTYNSLPLASLRRCSAGNDKIYLVVYSHVMSILTPASEAGRRRTFAIISHPDAGKTTLTEHLLLLGGAIHLAGAGEGAWRGAGARTRTG